MSSRVKLSHLTGTLEGVDYPLGCDEAAAVFDDVTLVMADGEANLGSLIAASERDRFQSAEDLYTELNNVMPIEALGEPGQSEGDA